jgi:hypothetical protein
MQEGNQINLNDQGKLPEFSDVCKKRHHKQASKQATLNPFAC